MTPSTLLRSITAQIAAFKAAATTSPEDAAEIEDLRAQLDGIKHEGARAAIVRDIERKTSLAKVSAARRADDEVRELYDDAELKRAFGLRVRATATSELVTAPAEELVAA